MAAINSPAADGSDSVRSLDEDGWEVWHDANGELHRLDGPAMIDPNDLVEYWYLHGKQHRNGGPAVENKLLPGHLAPAEWWRHGERHRTDGPALVNLPGMPQWWVNDQPVPDNQVITLRNLCRYGKADDLEQVLTIWRPDGPTCSELLAAIRAAAR